MSFSEVNSVGTFSSDVSSAMAPLPSAGEVLQLIQVMGKSDAMKYVSKQQELFGRCLTGYYRTSSSASSGSSNGCDKTVYSGVGPEGRSVSPRARLAQLRGLSSWRSNSRTADGLCYTKLMTSSGVVDAQRLGEWPTLGRLLATDWESFKPLSQLRLSTVDFDAAVGLAHVRSDSSGRYSFVDLASGVAAQRGQRKGSLGAVLKAAGGDFIRLPDGFSSRIAFGGELSGKLLSSASGGVRGKCFVADVVPGLSGDVVVVRTVPQHQGSVASFFPGFVRFEHGTDVYFVASRAQVSDFAMGRLERSPMCSVTVISSVEYSQRDVRVLFPHSEVKNRGSGGGGGSSSSALLCCCLSDDCDC